MTIPNSVTSIGFHAFAYCSGLTSVAIGNSVTCIDNGAFYKCSGLTSLTIPNSVTSIVGYAFGGCSGLKDVVIGKGVENIGVQAFASCKNLESVTCWAVKVPSTDVDAFKDSYVDYATLIVPESAVADFKATAPWSGFGTFKTLEGGNIPEPLVKKCAKPTIAFADNKLIYRTETEDAEVVGEIKVADAKKTYDKEVSLIATYDITAYATKSGYDDSDVATATLVWATATLKNETSGAKTISVDAMPLLIKQEEGLITVSGLNDGETIIVRDPNGALITTSKVIGTSTLMNLSELKGKVAILSVGDKSTKILIK